ncbi:MAG: hypothetical protein K0R09_645 [Clostridiales bacterium]|nr:hypothetical protein [Clostridiales bacterium]
MNRKVLISVKTVQFLDGQPEEIELITEGEYYKDGNEYFASYDESEISGMEGTKTTMKIENDALAIIRQGTTNSNLIFKKNLNHVSLYSTPYGSLEVTVKPSKVAIDISETGGKVELAYIMEASGIEPMDNTLELNIKQIS